ncbi:hypothetical protein JCM16303_003097 [Sporobolomyces ruberrimus]
MDSLEARKRGLERTEREIHDLYKSVGKYICFRPWYSLFEALKEDDSNLSDDNEWYDMKRYFNFALEELATHFLPVRPVLNLSTST